LGGKTFYFHYDERGSVIYLTNDVGHIVQRYWYDSFGRNVLRIGNMPNAFTYTGRQWDADAGLYHYRARAYDPAAGIFLQQDPIFAANPYAYVNNNPINFIDPLGLDITCSDRYAFVEGSGVCHMKECNCYDGKDYTELTNMMARDCPYIKENGFVQVRGGIFGREVCQQCARDCKILCARLNIPLCEMKCNKALNGKSKDPKNPTYEPYTPEVKSKKGNKKDKDDPLKVIHDLKKKLEDLGLNITFDLFKEGAVAVGIGVSGGWKHEKGESKAYIDVVYEVAGFEMGYNKNKKEEYADSIIGYKLLQIGPISIDYDAKPLLNYARNKSLDKGTPYYEKLHYEIIQYYINQDSYNF